MGQSSPDTYLEVDDARMIHSVFSAIGEDVLVHVTGLDGQSIVDPGPVSDRQAMLAQAGLAAPVGIAQIDKGLRSDGQIAVAVDRQRSHGLYLKPEHQASIVVGIDGTLFEPGPPAQVVAEPLASPPSQLLPVAIFEDNVPGSATGTKSCVANPGRQAVIDGVAYARTQQVLVDAAANVEVTRLAVEPLPPAAFPLVCVKGVGR